jgi:hypothetical protein
MFAGAAVAGAAPPASQPTTRAVATTQAAPDPDLFASWSAARSTDAEATDASGHNRAAKPTSGKVATDKVGGRTGFRIKAGAGALAAGEDGGFDFTADFSVALWVRLAGEQTGVTLIGKRSADGRDGWAIVSGIQGIGGIGFVAAPDVFVPTTGQAVNEWVHVAVTFHRREFLLYVDGKAIGVAELPQVPRASKQPLLVGVGADGKGPIDGWVDDVRIYHRGLTADDVEALAAGREPKPAYPPLTPAQKKRVRDLIDALGADAFEERERAAAELKAMGRPIFPMLRARLETEGGEVSLRIKNILGELPQTPAPDAGGK